MDNFGDKLSTAQKREAWQAFCEMRREKGKRAPFTAAAKKRIGFELRRLAADGHDPVEVLWQSVINGWSGVFPLKDRPRTIPMVVAAPSIDATSEYLKREAEHLEKVNAERQRRKEQA